MFENDDPFEEIVNQFFGGRRQSQKRYRKIREENEENTYSIEEKDYIYILIEIPGYRKDDIKVDVRNNILEINVNKTKSEEEIQRDIPSNANPKRFTYTYTNGILEVKFAKK